MVDENVNTEVISDLRYSSRKLIRELGMLELNKPHLNRTPQHWHTLIEIYNQPGITIAKLGNILILTYSTILRIVSSLLKEQLVSSKNGIDKRENYLYITEKGIQELIYINEYSNTKIKGAFEFLSEDDQQQIVEAIKKYAMALEKSRVLREQIKINTLSTARTLRKQIISMVEDIQRNEFSLPITDDINAGILKAEAEFYYNKSYNFWYAINNTGEIIGCIGLIKIDEENAEIKKFFVRKQFRGKGVAKKLMHTLIKSAVKHHFKKIFLGTVDTLLAAQKFYKKYGFSQINEHDLPKKFNRCPIDTVFFMADCKVLEAHGLNINGIRL
jgi:N-acetylglutamate synthase-like GNAT family acetyltransferase/DNA-binding MarR family transcriptional regulator